METSNPRAEWFTISISKHPTFLPEVTDVCHRARRNDMGTGKLPDWKDCQRDSHAARHTGYIGFCAEPRWWKYWRLRNPANTSFAREVFVTPCIRT